MVAEVRQKLAFEAEQRRVQQEAKKLADDAYELYKIELTTLQELSKSCWAYVSLAYTLLSNPKSMSPFLCQKCKKTTKSEPFACPWGGTGTSSVRFISLTRRRRSEVIRFCGIFCLGAQTPDRKGQFGPIIHERNPEPVKETYTEMYMFID